MLHAQGIFAQIAPQDHFLAYDAATAMSMTEASSTPATAEAGSVLKSPLSALPALNSNLDAAAQLYLDFDGDLAMTWGDYLTTATPAYDSDGNPATYTSTELAAIQEIWGRVAEKYSPFNINVTTVNPGTLRDGRSMRVLIGGDGLWSGGTYGGIAYVAGFYSYDPNTVFVFSDNLGNGNATYVAEAAAHEAGHSFGLEHQSNYDSRGRLLSEYYAGTSWTAPIMGYSYDARGVWWYGATTSSMTYQDDMAMLAGPENAFGYRPDDHADAIEWADPLAVQGDAVSASGIIGKTSDLDCFSFTTGGGMVSFSIDVVANGATLDLRAELLKDDGTLVAAADTSTLGETLSAAVEAGSYRLVVMSHGDHGDVGQYTLSGSIVPTDVSAPTAPANLLATARTLGRVFLTWDPVDASGGYVIERSIDGVEWTALATVGPNSTRYLDRSLRSATTYHYRIHATNSAGSSPSDQIVSVTTLNEDPPTMPDRATSIILSRYRVKLVWNDTSDNESGFRIQWSPDAVYWYNVGRVTADRTSANLLVWRRGTTYFRVSAFNRYGESAYDQSSSAVVAVKTRGGFALKRIFSTRPVRASLLDQLAAPRSVL